MPCYIENTQAASRQEYDFWVSLGYHKSFEEYLESKKGTAGTRIFFCGELGECCADCAGIGDTLCDFPVGDGKTCDRAMCKDHAHEIGLDIHYCETHYRMWTEFKNAGGVHRALENVIAIKSEK